jgi:transposase-like protein
MGNFRIIDPSIKAEALNNVRNNGMSVSEAATKYGVTSRTIYG